MNEKRYKNNTNYFMLIKVIQLLIVSKLFNPEMQHTDTESATKNKLVNLLSGLRTFKFVTTLVLESDDETRNNSFC